ncbi:FIG00614596: hypothetical protein [hydrothermal vent metagenome]|uniref:DUF4914 domain-containing protein n=1 Tax=hydrothermal vent metagenome TaxID=652676 RepID=A0A3B1E586_9ZZZZ
MAIKEIKTFKNIELSKELQDVLENAKKVITVESKADLVELSMGGNGADTFEVAYDISGKGRYVEVNVDRCRNGVSANYTEAYMRRRDPDSMVIADDKPTNKVKFSERFKQPFTDFRQETLDWLKGEELIILPFYSGSEDLRYDSLLVAPLNASFFAAGLADLQGMIPFEKVEPGFKPKVLIYLTPTFRHTHCDGKQVVVHNRTDEAHEIFALNLYPGPSAKKGIYGALLTLGEKEGWITVHGSTVLVTTPYDNEFVIMHEGASGGGKSEMLQYPHREPDGRLLVGENVLTGKRRYIPLFQGCTLRPVTDDMAICPNNIQTGEGKLVVKDAENGWFVRVNHITRYGVDRYVERMCTNPPEPLVFLNMYSVPKATCLIWEHTEDAPGQPCPNPRVILPRDTIDDIIDGPVEVDVRSFGVRTPPCTRENPSYGILGMLHVLPPALAWLWRLVSPRGYDNPSVTETEGMSSEGVGSYWPFATGRRIDQANLLLKQIINTPKTRYTLTPNQHVGAWRVGFMAQWIVREYLSRRGTAKFREAQMDQSRCSLLGYAAHALQIEGFFLNREFLQINLQKEVGDEAYDKGAEILKNFFKQELNVYLKDDDLDPLGRKIIEGCMNDVSVEEYAKFITVK